MFCISGKSLPSDWSNREYVLRLLIPGSEGQYESKAKQRMQHEAQTLLALKELDFSYSTPEFICFICQGAESTGRIETAVPGGPAQMLNSENLLRTIASAAAAVHRLDPQRFTHLPSSPDRAQHVLDRLGEFTTDLFPQFPLAIEAREWILGHLPPSDPACLLESTWLERQRGEYGGQSPEQYEQQLRSLLRRAASESD